MTRPCVVALEPSVDDGEGGFTAEVRRVVMSTSFQQIYDGKILCKTVTPSHPLGPVVPANRMTFNREIVLVDWNKEARICIAEALYTTHQTLILIRDVGPRTPCGIVMPRVHI